MSQPEKTVFAVTLLSGGLDSTTVTAYARRKVDRLVALTFHYGQSHSREVESAREVARALGVEHRLLDISFLQEVAWYSALTNPDRFPIPKENDPQKLGFSVPITYVPLRNTIFLALAAALLESEVLHAIEVEGLEPAAVGAAVYLAPNALDYSGYPDCRPEYYQRMRPALEYGSKLWTQYEVPIRVETPIIGLSKGEIVRLALEVEAPLALTWSCYEGGPLPCGGCDSCLLRAKGFQEAGVLDPLLERLGRA